MSKLGAALALGIASLPLTAQAASWVTLAGVQPSPPAGTFYTEISSDWIVPIFPDFNNPNTANDQQLDIFNDLTVATPSQAYILQPVLATSKDQGSWVIYPESVDPTGHHASADNGFAKVSPGDVIRGQVKMTGTSGTAPNIGAVYRITVSDLTTGVSKFSDVTLPNGAEPTYAHTAVIEVATEITAFSCQEFFPAPEVDFTNFSVQAATYSTWNTTPDSTTYSDPTKWSFSIPDSWPKNNCGCQLSPNAVLCGTGATATIGLLTGWLPAGFIGKVTSATVTPPASWNTLYSDRLFAGDTGVISGSFPSGSCGLTSILATSTPDTPKPGVVGADVIGATTRVGGQFEMNYTPALAGQKTVTFSMGGHPGYANLGTLIAPVYPGLAMLNPNIGPVAGGQNGALSGIGLRDFPQPIVPLQVKFGDPPTAGATNIHVIDSKDASLSTPQSPLAGNGVGQVEVVASVDLLDSEPVRYQYILPGVPLLTVSPRTCLPSVITPSVFNAQGQPQLILVTLKAPYPAFNGQIQVVVQAGTNVPYTGAGGNIVATTCAFCAGGTSTTAVPPSLTVCLGPLTCGTPSCGPAMIPVSGPDPRSTINPMALAGAAQWTDQAVPGDFIKVNGANPGNLIAQITVTGFDVRGLQALVAANPYVFVNTTKNGTRQFVGGAMKVQMAVGTALPGAGLISFQTLGTLPTGSTFRIVTLNASGYWSEVTPAPSAPPNTVQAPISSTGTYALTIFTEH